VLPPLLPVNQPVSKPRSVSVASASILAITDDAEVRDLLLELAISEGYGVRCAPTEAEAASVLRLERPGLILVDLDMEPRTGAKFLRTLRQSPYRDIPCIAVTASNDPMLQVSIDAPVFYKPSLDGLDAALDRLFHGTV
jgi:CheY-like chemotaxis protein